jgi:hypothetical protein
MGSAYKTQLQYVVEVIIYTLSEMEKNLVTDGRDLCFNNQVLANSTEWFTIWFVLFCGN